MSSNKRNLRPEQATAAHELSRHVSVSAGPGSGKTSVLIERYLHILREHRNLSIDQIVAITFTNRAANEMRERLRSELNHIVESSVGDERQRWMRYKRTLDGGVISTIHGFCARLLREFPVEAKIDPQFVLLDEHRTAMLLQSAVEETLTSFISSQSSEISRLTLGLGRRKLAAAIEELYSAVRGQGLSLPDLKEQVVANHANEARYEEALNDLRRQMANFFSVRRMTPATLTTQARVSSGWRVLQPFFEVIPGAEDLPGYCGAIEEFRKLRPQARGAIAGHVQALDPLIWEKDLHGKVPRLCLDLFARKYSLRLIDLIKQLDDRLAAQKQKLSVLDFDDLQLRALSLLEDPKVLAQTASRYRFFLVDEFQDTNEIQRRLLKRLALRPGTNSSRANLFIVGDRKQSIYGFRGADVDIFRHFSNELIAAGGVAVPLRSNFRSRPAIIYFCNLLFDRLFKPNEEVSAEKLDELGYVHHEPSFAEREAGQPGPLVEILVSQSPAKDQSTASAEQDLRERDAQHIAQRITALVSSGRENLPGNHRPVQYGEIALLFRAMSQVQRYEAVFRRAHIPYQTILGRGFYEREEITDLIQLLRFLDNRTDELALAAVLRSPLVGISDNALLALRCAPKLTETAEEDRLRYFAYPRQLRDALQNHRQISFLSEEEHGLLDLAAELLSLLSERRQHCSIAELLRFAVAKSEYETVVAASFDGAQRLANVRRLFTLADRFEQTGANLIRDFVRYVEEFEAIGSRESEGQIDQAANAVRLMSIHQAKGLEFPVVIIPDLHRSANISDSWFLLDRHRGLTLKVPDGRGKLLAGATFQDFHERRKLREEFESTRLLYVATTRAQERLIFSGAVTGLENLTRGHDSWLLWIWQALELGKYDRTGIIELSNDVTIKLQINVNEKSQQPTILPREPQPQPKNSEKSWSEPFPLMKDIAPDGHPAIHRFSVTRMTSFKRCPRQYYFERVLHVPSYEAIAVWTDPDSPEPPANLTATLKGAVIHRFCETYTLGDDLDNALEESLKSILCQRRADLSDRSTEIDQAKALQELRPLAENYLKSSVFNRVQAAKRRVGHQLNLRPAATPGIWSEVTFQLRRPLGIITGTIDKLLVSAENGAAADLEIVDFKTNRFRSAVSSSARPSLADQIKVAASDYELQMQAYVLAVNELLAGQVRKLTATLHFLQPNVEVLLPEDILKPNTCRDALDEALERIVVSHEPEEFPVRPSDHCRTCKFLNVCTAGRRWLDVTTTLAE